ncbi:unnamed protein product [Acanthosepion pharaonis]|uniref:Uncharacterized protein n=1 Tax=Acanthosepion pharaonis TaxID=158019 RepID=A0A812AMC5_ACAPH|nr:unnamed protein product [Sepia pharaonis]
MHKHGIRTSSRKVFDTGQCFIFYLQHSYFPPSSCFSAFPSFIPLSLSLSLSLSLYQHSYFPLSSCFFPFFLLSPLSLSLSLSLSLYQHSYFPLSSCFSAFLSSIHSLFLIPPLSLSIYIVVSLPLPSFLSSPLSPPSLSLFSLYKHSYFPPSSCFSASLLSFLSSSLPPLSLFSLYQHSYFPPSSCFSAFPFFHSFPLPYPPLSLLSLFIYILIPSLFLLSCFPFFHSFPLPYPLSLSLSFSLSFLSLSTFSFLTSPLPVIFLHIPSFSLNFFSGFLCFMSFTHFLLTLSHYIFISKILSFHLFPLNSRVCFPHSFFIFIPNNFLSI